MVHHRCVPGVVAIGLFVLASAAHGQCEPSWDVTPGNPGITSGYIQPMVAWNDGTGERLFVGGSAVDIGGNFRNDYLAQYDPSTGQWSRVGTGIGQGSTNAFLTKILPWDDGTGEKLYVVGQFAAAGGLTSANSFAVWDGSTWADVGAGFTQTTSRVTYDLLPADLGHGEKLYLAGNWSSIGGATVSGLATYDGQTFAPWGTGDGIDIWGGFSPFVQSLMLWDDGSGPAVYACGRFLGIDSASSTNIARYNVATEAWESFGSPLIPTSSLGNMTSWAIFDDGTGEALYLGGQTFRISGDPNVYVVARWDGTTWTGIGQTLSGRVTDLRVWDDGNGPALYLSGTAVFEVNYFARLEGNTWVPAQSGVNNPPVNGNFSSAFGLYEWNDNLLVGGNFSQVGGLDPVTGVGEGTPIPARGLAALTPCRGTSATLTDVTRTLGLFVSGGVPELLESDDTYYILQSGPGFDPSEPHPARADFTFDSAGFAASTLDITLEEKSNIGGPTAVVLIRDRVNAEWDELDRFSLSPTDQTFEMTGIPAAEYIGGGGNIKVRVRTFAILILNPAIRGIFSHDFVGVAMRE